MNATASSKPAPSPGAKLAMDFGPLLLFFLVNMFAPVDPLEKIFVATGTFMIATVIAMVWCRIATGHISAMLWFNGVMVVVFGGATLWLHNAEFIKIKPTIYYAMLSALLFFGVWRNKPTLKLVLGPAYPGLTERGWALLSRNWAWFFLAMAVANEIVWRHASTSLWVSYKLFGALPATVLFALGNVPLIMKHGMGEGAAASEIAQLPPEG